MATAQAYGPLYNSSYEAANGPSGFIPGVMTAPTDVPNTTPGMAMPYTQAGADSYYPHPTEQVVYPNGVDQGKRVVSTTDILLFGLIVAGVAGVVAYNCAK